jgi:5'-3' exonuclease
MGIKGFPQYINKNLNHLFETFGESRIKNSRVAIDIGGFMHKFTECMSYPTEYVDRFLAFTEDLRSLGVQFIYVFDGVVALSKADTLNERRRKREFANRVLDEKIAHFAKMEEKFTKLLAESIVQKIGFPVRLVQTLDEIRKSRLQIILRKNPVNRRFFYHLETVFCQKNIPYLVADQEAEKACAWLAQRGHVDIVISEDYDTLLCGAPVMLRRWRSDVGPPCTVSLHNLLESMGLSYTEFVTTCVLAGTDFAKPPTSYGFRKALQSVRETIRVDDFSAKSYDLSAKSYDLSAKSSPDILRKTFDRVYRSSYKTPGEGDQALASFEEARQLFSGEQFPFRRSLLILATVWLVSLLRRQNGVK